MLDKFLVLLERFVVAHELIAKTNAERGTLVTGDFNAELAEPAVRVVDKELPVEGESVVTQEMKYKGNANVKRAKDNIKSKPEPEDDLSDDDAPEEKPVRKAKAAPKPKEEPTVDIAAIREDIKTIAKHIAAGESDQCADLFDELLEEYKVRTVTKLPDDAVEAFLKDAKTLVAKYYDVED